VHVWSGKDGVAAFVEGRYLGIQKRLREQWSRVADELDNVVNGTSAPVFSSSSQFPLRPFRMRIAVRR
jgi:hypothetical protein